MVSLLLSPFASLLRGPWFGAPLAGVVEHVEATLGAAIDERDDAVAHFSREGGLGPPDLVWLRKAPADGRGEPEGSYHYVFGADVSSPASVAAYFAQLVNAVEQPTGLVGRALSAPTVVEGGLLCCYDAVSRVDLRCELVLPGGCNCFTMDGVGELTPLPSGAVATVEAWQRGALSSTLRSLRAPSALLAHLGCARLLPPPHAASPVAESALLESVLALRGAGGAAAFLNLAGRGPGVLPDGSRHWHRAPPEDVLLGTLARHLVAHRRPTAALSLLRQAHAQDSAPGAAPLPAPAAPLLALTLAAAGQAAEADAVLGAALLCAPNQPHCCLALVALGASRPEGADAALLAARATCASAPAAREPWLRLAAAAAAKQRWAEALVALNCAAPVGATEETASDPWLGWFPTGQQPAAARSTEPLRWPDSAVLWDAAQAAEEAALPGRASLAALPAAQLLPPPEELPCALGATPRAAPLPPTLATAAAAYAVLVEVVATLGWDGFLQLRSALFLMEAPAQEEAEAASDADAEADTEPSTPSGGDVPPPPRRAGARDAGKCAPGPPAPFMAAGAPPGALEEAEPAAGDATQPGESQAADDRIALMSGAPLVTRRLCAEWLDALIGALFDDISEYSAWRNAEAAEVADARAAAGEEVDMAPHAGVDRDAALGTAGDWARRGALCERLLRPDDAERAYRVCVHLGFHAGAWQALARMYAAWGWAGEALTAVGQLATAAPSDAAAAAAVARPLAALVAGCGLQAVREAQEGLGKPHAALNACFHDVVRWKCEGWDK